MIYKYQTKSKNEAYCLLKSMDIYFCLYDLDQWLRDKIKYHDKNEYEPVREELSDIMCGHGVDFDNVD